MRRGFCATLFGVCCAVLLRSACPAQITFVPGNALNVTAGPAFVAAADFNGDGVTDVAVSHTLSGTVTLLLGCKVTDACAGGFSAAVAVPVGTRLRGITTGDFNG